MGFSRQEYWSGLPCPPPQDLPNPGIEPTSLACPALAGRFFTTSATSPYWILSGGGINASTCCAHHCVGMNISTFSHIPLNLQDHPKPESLSPLFYKWKLEAQRGEVICSEWLSHVGGARLTLWVEDWSKSPFLPTPPPYLRMQPPATPQPPHPPAAHRALLWSSVHESALSVSAGRESQTPWEPGNNHLAASQPRLD